MHRRSLMLQRSARVARLGAGLIRCSRRWPLATQPRKRAASRQPQPVNPNAAVIKRIPEARRRIRRAPQEARRRRCPKLPKQTTPQEIDAHERALAKLIQAARKDAKPGDISHPGDAAARAARCSAPIFAGADGAQIKAEILDNEYKGDVKLAVNGRYPDEVPVSTVPPQVLAGAAEAARRARVPVHPATT